MINYIEDVKYVANLQLPWEKLNRKTILLSGSTGMIGSFLVHVLMNRNEDINIIALGRNIQIAKERFSEYWNSNKFTFISHDINQLLKEKINVDYVIHAASNTHPIAYATDPIGTITTNIIGLINMLDYAIKYQAKRFLFTSSVEIYGENRGDIEYFDEDYCGYINCNLLRAGYPESKRAGEALCQAYKSQKEIEIVIARLSRTYGPTMLKSDTKAISQFIKKAISKEDIVLKSEGNQFYSYNYVADSVSGLLTILLKGQNGEAYNISDIKSNITLKDMAKIIAQYVNKKVIFSLPDEREASGYSKATKAIMNSKKLQSIGWKAHWDIESGLHHTIDLLLS